MSQGRYGILTQQPGLLNLCVFPCVYRRPCQAALQRPVDPIVYVTCFTEIVRGCLTTSLIRGKSVQDLLVLPAGKL